MINCLSLRKMAVRAAYWIKKASFFYTGLSLSFSFSPSTSSFVGRPFVDYGYTTGQDYGNFWNCPMQVACLTTLYAWHSSVNEVIGYGQNDVGRGGGGVVGVDFQQGQGQGLFLFARAWRLVCGVHPASYLLDTVGSLPEGSASGSWNCPLNLRLLSRLKKYV
jgi:hypothetical protein